MMWPYYGTGWSWLWMAGMMVVFWGGIVFLGIWALRSLATPRPAGEDPLNTLRKRLAAGEINQDEFEKTRRLLQG